MPASSWRNGEANLRYWPILLSLANLAVQGQTRNPSLGADVKTRSSDTGLAENPQMPVNLTERAGSWTYLSNTSSVYEYYPVVGWEAGDHQRAQNIISFNSQFDASKFETALAINAYTTTGYAKTYLHGAYYTTGDYVANKARLYRVKAGGTSASEGPGPDTLSTSLVDGSMTLEYVTGENANGKSALFISDVAEAGSGHVWGSSTDVVLQPGYAGGFATTAEFDMSNSSGMDCETCQTVFITGTPGRNKIQTGVSIYNPDETRYAYVNGVQISGPKLAVNADLLLNTTASYGIQDVGKRQWGAALSGLYAQGALVARGKIRIAMDRPTVELVSSDSDSTPSWRITSTATDAGDGDFIIQHTEKTGPKTGGVATVLVQPNGFVGIGTRPAFPLEVAGTAGVGTLQLKPTRFSELPPCLSTKAGLIAYVTDARDPIVRWHQQVGSGGGSARAFIACNGSAWFAFDY